MAFLASAPAVVSLLGTGVTTAATLASMSAQKKIAEHNALQDEAAAKAAQAQAARDEEAQRREASAFLGKQQAAFAEAGLGSAGTAGLLQDQSAVLAELDALNIRYEGELDARGLLAQSSLSTFEGRVSGRNARTAGQAGALSAASTLLAGASNAYGYARTPRPGGT